MSNSLQPHESQHARPPCPSPTPLLESTQTHVHWVSDTIQPSHPLPSPSPPAPNPSQHQGLFKWVNSSHEVARHSIGVSTSASVLPMNTQDWSPLGWTGWISLQFKGLSSLLQHHSSKGSILWLSAFFMVQLSHPYRTWKFFWLFSFEKQAFIYSPLIH